MPSQESENSKVPGMELTDETPEKEKHIIHKLDICVKKLQLNSKDSIKVTQAFLDGLQTSKYRNVEPNYDIVLYWPLESDKYTKQEKLVITDKNKELDMKPKRRIIRAHPSRGGFVVSIHGVCKRRN